VAMKVVLVDCLIYQGLHCHQRRHAATRSDRNEPTTTRMKRAHCLIALLQTVIRDLAALAVVVTCIVIEPWGTLIILGTVAAIIIMVGRTRLSLFLLAVVIACVTLALVNGSANARISLGIPLACLSGCFTIYLADVLLSIHYVRKLWRQPNPQNKSRFVDKSRIPGRTLVFRESARSESQRWLYGNGNGHGGKERGHSAYSNGRHDGNPSQGNGLNGNTYHNPGYGIAGQNGSQPAPSMGEPAKIYYGKNGIVGAGTPGHPVRLTVPLDKAHDAEKEIEKFTASDLLEDISHHLLSQSAGDTQVHGYAYRPLSADDAAGNSSDPRHFTYGLPNLEVNTVAASPLPEPGRIPGVPVSLFRLNYRDVPPRDEMVNLANRSPSEHPERHYVRARTSSWDGQLVATVFVSAALQGHYLRMTIRPYVLAPVVYELSAADELARWNPFILTFVAVSVTARQFLNAAGRFRGPAAEQGKSSRAKPMSGMRSTRENYARPYVNNIHQYEDSERAISIIEEKVFRATMDYLRKHNLDIDDYERQVQNIFYNNTVNGTGNITAGTFSNSQVASAAGQGNSASNTSSTPNGRS
jgi:hypothetical protein